MNRFIGALVVFVTVASSCSSTTLLRGQFIGASNLPESRLQKAAEATVAGKSCQRLFFGFGLSEANFQLVLADAVRQAPSGVRGLMDVRIMVSTGPGGMFARRCFIVEGVPARLR